MCQLAAMQFEGLLLLVTDMPLMQNAADNSVSVVCPCLPVDL